MNIADPIGVPGAPQETLRALTNYFERPQLDTARLIMLTDRTGDRLHARYAALIVTGHDPELSAVMSAPAFGPYFGEAGTEALIQLGHWAAQNNLPVRETVINAPNFNRIVGEPEPRDVAALMSASNPADVHIYTTPPKKQDD